MIKEETNLLFTDNEIIYYTHKIKRIYKLPKLIRQFTRLLDTQSLEKPSNFPRHQQQPIKNVSFD